MSRRFLTLFVTILAIASNGSAQSGIDLIRQSFDKRSSVIGSFIVWRTVKAAEDARIMAKVDSDGFGNTKTTILQPLRYQGQITLDNGNIIQVLQQDKKVYFTMPSPTPNISALKERAKLIGRNYTLVASKGPEIAGQKTYLIAAKPKARSFPSRKLYLDTQNLYPMKVESIVGRDSETILDTISAEFGRRRRDKLALPKPSDYTMHTVEAPDVYKSVREASKKAGFSPIWPDELPYGFAIERVELTSFSKDKALDTIVIRLTDGFLSLTVYQFEATPVPSQAMQNLTKVERELGNVRVVVTGEAPFSVLQRFADSCLGRREGLFPQQELYPSTLR